MTDQFTINLPKLTEKMLIARYDNMLQKALEKAFEDYELYKPMVRMAGLTPVSYTHLTLPTNSLV